MRSGIRFLGVVLLVGGVGVAAGYLFADRLAERELAAVATEPTWVPITDEVALERVVDEAAFAGVVGAPAVVALPVDFTGRVLTRLPEAGVVIEPQTAPFEVEGQPVVALSGDLTPWRDFTRGMSPGPDVAALQSALAEGGWYDGEPDGRYGSGTSSAFADLLESLGYPRPSGSTIARGQLLFIPGPIEVGPHVNQQGRVPTDPFTAVTGPAPLIVELPPSVVASFDGSSLFLERGAERVPVSVAGYDPETQALDLADGPPLTAGEPIGLVVVRADTVDPVPVVPYSALRTDSTGAFLWVGSDFATVEKVHVTTGVSDGFVVEIVDPALEPGTEILLVSPP